MIWQSEETIQNKIENFLFDIDVRLYSLFKIEIPPCGEYDGLEPCCNNSYFCDYMCSCGIGGCKRLFLSNIFYKLCRIYNKIRSKLCQKN